MTRPLASIGDRFTAQFIDGLAALAIGAGFYVAAEALGWPLQWAFAGWLVYLLLCDGLPGGASLGKRFTRSAVVVISTGQPCSYWRSSVRNLTLLVLGVIDAAFIVGKERRRLGDYLAGTRVVRAGA